MPKTPPELSLTETSNSAFRLPTVLSYPWDFNTCVEFCQEFGIHDTALLTRVFEKIKILSLSTDPQVFAHLYGTNTLPVFIEKISTFPEFKHYLENNQAEYCLPLLSQRLHSCFQYKKLLLNIIDLFPEDPIKACLALARFTHSVDLLPEGEEKNQLLWLLDNTRQAWYKENYLVKHALNSPFIENYLHTAPNWAPCVDSILGFFKKNPTLSADDWHSLLALLPYNGSLFCETLSQYSFLNQLDLNLFTADLQTHADNLPYFLTLTQHHPARFSAWAQWVNILPEQAFIIFSHWKKQLSHLNPLELSAQDTALQNIIQDQQAGRLLFEPQGTSAFRLLLNDNVAIQTPALTNREQDKRPETKRHILTEMALLTSVKTTCWLFGAIRYMPALAHEVYNLKIAPKLGRIPSSDSGFDPAFYGMYAAVGHPLSGNRIFQYTGQESFSTTFLNGFKLFKQAHVGKRYFEHLNNPLMSDAEFYKRILAQS